MADLVAVGVICVLSAIALAVARGLERL